MELTRTQRYVRRFANAERTIYGIKSTECGCIRYVGQTWRPLAKRLATHMTNPHNERMERWFKYLAENNHEPVIFPIAKSVGSDAYDVERQWIQSLSCLYGSTLLNYTGRGDFVSTYEIIQSSAKQRRLERERKRHTRWVLYMCRSNDSPDNSRLRYIEHDGRCMCISEWADEIGLSRQRISQRLKKLESLGADPSLAVSTPRGQRMPV